MGNSNSNFNAGKNKEILNKLKNLLAESESNPEIMAGCNDLISKLKTLVEDSEVNTGGQFMSNDFKVNAVTGDSENLPAPEIVAAEIDVVAVGMPSHSAFETTEKPAESNIMASMDEMFGGSIMDGIKSLLGAANNTEHVTESNEMNTHVNNLKQLLEQTEDNVMMGGAIDNVTVQRLQHLLAETEQNVMAGGAIDDVTVQRLQHLLAETEQNVMSGGAIDDVSVQRLQNLLAETESFSMAGGQVEANDVSIQHLQNLLAETESFSMAGGQVGAGLGTDENVNNLRNLLVQSESNFNYQTVNLRGGKVESENLFSSENQPLEKEKESENENLDVSGGSEQSGGEELSSELVEILKSLKKENKENKSGGSRKGDSRRRDEDEEEERDIKEEMESDFQGNTAGKWEEFQDEYKEHVGKSRKPKSKHEFYREWESQQFGGKRRTSKKSSRKSSRKSRRMSKDSDYDLDDDMDMDTDDEDYLSTSSLNTSDINIRHYR
jgi:hypothetical protein